MSASKAQIAIWSNQQSLEEAFCQQTLEDKVSFVHDKNSVNPIYNLLLIDLTQDLSHVSQRIISVYQRCRDAQHKLVVALLHPHQVDLEKNLYFTELLTRLGETNPLHRLIFVKDLFQVDLQSSLTWLDQFILEAVVDRKITISTKGKNYFYPLSFHSFIQALLKIFFLSNTSGKVFWLVGDPFSDLELAYLIKRTLVDSEGSAFEIDATGQNIFSEIDIVSLGNSSRVSLNWNPEEDLFLTIKNFVHLSNDQNLSTSNLHKIFKSQPSLFSKITSPLLNLRDYFREHKDKVISTHQGSIFLKKGIKAFLVFVVFTYLSISLSFISFTALSLKLLETSLNSLRNGQVAHSVNELNQSLFYSQIGESSYSFISSTISIFAPKIHTQNYNLFTLERYLQTSLSNLQQTYSLADKILSSIGSNSGGLNYNDVGLALRSNLVQVYENLNQIELFSRPGSLPPFLEKKIRSSSEYANLSQIKDQLFQLTKVVDLIPALLAGDSVKNIAILFQNSHELRSTGGVINFLLVLSLDRGRVISHQIYQDSELDSLATGLIQAPPMIQLYSGISDWKFRDMNYNPDFPQTAENLSWFINKVLKFKPDAILGVNDHIIQSFLNQDKSVQINNTIIGSADLERDLATSRHSLLYRQTIEHYLDRLLQRQLSLLTISRVLAKEIGENQLLFWTADSLIEQTIIDQPYSGAIAPHLCHGGLRSTKTCLTQTTFLNESNLSLIPIDHSLNRQITHKVWLEINQIRHEYLLDYHFSQTTSSLDRNLNEAIQLYIPSDSFLDKVTLDGEILPLNTLSTQTDKNLNRVQIPFSLSFGSDHHLSLQFHTPLYEPMSSSFAYSLTEYRQSGSVGPGTKLQIYYPDKVRPAAVTAPIVTGANGFIYNFPLHTSTFGVNFAPKSF